MKSRWIPTPKGSKDDVDVGVGVEVGASEDSPPAMLVSLVL